MIIERKLIIKKIVSLALVVSTLIVSLAINTSAASIAVGNVSANYSLTATAAEKEAIIDALNFVSLDKSAFNLESVNFELLEIGQKIYRYEFTTNGFEYLHFSYPIIYNNDVILMATKYSSGKFQISSYEAEAINNSGMDAVSMIYDSEGFYLYDGNVFSLVSYSGETIDTRANLSEYINESNSSQYSFKTLNTYVSSLSNQITITDLTVKSNLGYYDFYSNTYSLNDSGMENYYYCPVEFVSQNNMDICWAACVAMVTNYINYVDYIFKDEPIEHVYTAEEVAIAYLGEENMEAGADMSEIASLLRTTYTPDWFYASTEDTLSDELIKENLILECPIVAGFNIPTFDPHAVVVDCIHMTAGYIRICDPLCYKMTIERDVINEDQSSYGEYAYMHPILGMWAYWGCQASVEY